MNIDVRSEVEAFELGRDVIVALPLSGGERVAVPARILSACLDGLSLDTAEAIVPGGGLLITGTRKGRPCHYWLNDLETVRTQDRVEALYRSQERISAKDSAPPPVKTEKILFAPLVNGKRDIAVPAFAAKGLCIHHVIVSDAGETGQWWAVSHVESGLGFRYNVRSRTDARQALAFLLSLPVDWTSAENPPMGEHGVAIRDYFTALMKGGVAG